MVRRAWVRLDNASNIFLAARSDIDPKVFRISAEMDADVDPGLLQDALDETYDRFPLYHAVLRRGAFWHYLQDSDLRPVVAAETLATCAPIHRPGRPGLLFRVVHHRRRISLEIFHALSDGTGALWFLTALLCAYVRRRHPAQAPDVTALGTAPAAAPTTTDPVDPSLPDPEAGQGLVPDSFAHYFRRRPRAAAGLPGTDPPAFARVAAPAALSAAPTLPAASPASPDEDARSRTRGRTASRRAVHHVRGPRTPDHRTRAVELTMPAADVLALAKAEGVSLTMYLTALFLVAVRPPPRARGARRALAASVPVNLRQFFPSASARNFFATVRVEHVDGPEPAPVGEVARRLEAQFRPQTSPDVLGRRLFRLSAAERSPLLRIIPRPAKDLILGRLNALSNRRLTVAVSNLGRVMLPEPAESHVGRMSFHVSAVRPQFCAMSHAGELTVVFTSPFVQTDHVRRVARHQSGHGIDVRVAMARVTEAELTGATA